MEDTTEYLQPPEEKEIEGITFSKFQGDEEIAQIKELNDSLLSEAYSVFTYHYFLSEVTSITWTVCILSTILRTRQETKKGKWLVYVYASVICQEGVHWDILVCCPLFQNTEGKELVCVCILSDL